MFFTQEEIDQFRNETPGCKFKNHLNNAGAALMPESVIKAIQDYIHMESVTGGYETADLKAEAIQEFYRAAAKLFNCNPSNIALTTSATDSFSRAISSVPFQKGDVILTSNEDYCSNQITYISLFKRFGVEFIRTQSLQSGGVDLEDMERCIRKYHPRLVAITHVPTNSGLVQPIEEIGSICSRFETLYLVDACQSIGQIPLDMKAIQCDFLSVTARKFLRGPRGSGFLYVSDRALEAGLEPLFIDMRGADWISANEYKAQKTARRFEDWEFAYALVLGTAAAIDYLLKVDIRKVENQIKYLAHYTRTALQKLPGITILDKGKSPAGIVTCNMAGSSPQKIKDGLFEKNINVSISERTSAVIDYDAKAVDWAIRVSPHYYNTIQEIDELVAEMKVIAGNS